MNFTNGKGSEKMANKIKAITRKYNREKELIIKLEDKHNFNQSKIKDLVKLYDEQKSERNEIPFSPSFADGFNSFFSLGKENEKDIFTSARELEKHKTNTPGECFIN